MIQRQEPYHEAADFFDRLQQEDTALAYSSNGWNSNDEDYFHVSIKTAEEPKIKRSSGGGMSLRVGEGLRDRFHLWNNHILLSSIEDGREKIKSCFVMDRGRIDVEYHLVSSCSKHSCKPCTGLLPINDDALRPYG